MSYPNTKGWNAQVQVHYGYQVTGPLCFNERVWMACDLIKAFLVVTAGERERE